MRIGKLKIGIIVLVAVLTGCTGGEMFQDAIEDIPPIAANKSRIFIYRNTNPLLAFSPRLFILDGKPIADVYYGTSLYYDTTPGTHRISFNNPPQVLRITIPAGRAIYLEYYVTDGDNADNSTGIRMVPREKAERQMVNSILVDAKVRKFAGRPEQK